MTAHRDGLNDSAVLSGFLLGLLAGALVALFASPQSGKTMRQHLSSVGQSVRGKLEADPLADSIAAGKAAARRRREELGLNGQG
ncbi:MAG: YtxH domain-containing protein [Chloroflexi bacterium]|nr:YtxH domain-containing protein [Chloroflexota bacterium]